MIISTVMITSDEISNAVALSKKIIKFTILSPTIIIEHYLVSKHDEYTITIIIFEKFLFEAFVVTMQVSN